MGKFSKAILDYYAEPCEENQERERRRERETEGEGEEGKREKEGKRERGRRRECLVCVYPAVRQPPAHI